jgi:hypothetical protein
VFSLRTIPSLRHAWDNSSEVGRRKFRGCSRIAWCSAGRLKQRYRIVTLFRVGNTTSTAWRNRILERSHAPAHTPGPSAARFSPRPEPLTELVHVVPLCTSLRYHTKSSFLDRFLRQISGGLFLLRQGPPLSRRSWSSFSPARIESLLGWQICCVEDRRSVQCASD